MDRRTDRPFYRDAWTHLITSTQTKKQTNTQRSKQIRTLANKLASKQTNKKTNKQEKQTRKIGRNTHGRNIRWTGEDWVEERRKGGNREGKVSRQEKNNNNIENLSNF